MFAVMLIFVFAMSLIINAGERMVRHQQEEEVISEITHEEVLAADKPNKP
jgi:hypothetical protein